MKLLKKQTPYLVLLLALIILDQITKSVTENWLGYRNSYEVIENFFWIYILHNTGGAWSLFSGMSGLFMIVPPLAFAFMLYFYLKSDEKRILFRSALIFLMAGTLGNYIDRVMVGYVRDFLSFNIFGYMFPVFNVADISLNIGVGLFILETLLEGKK
jgi:signal peptidase II